jgi:hypothetical protein
MSKSLGEMILLDPVDVPNKQTLLDAAARLQKDFEVLSSYKTKQHNPEAYEAVASFLNFLAQKVKQ